MKKTKSKMKAKPVASQCNYWCCRPIPKPLDFMILLAAVVLIAYVFIKMSMPL